MEATCSSRNLVDFQQTAWNYIPECRTLQTFYCCILEKSWSETICHLACHLNFSCSWHLYQSTKPISSWLTLLQNERMNSVMNYHSSVLVCIFRVPVKYAVEAAWVCILYPVSSALHKYFKAVCSLVFYFCGCISR
jgi:hypothetical protein